MATAAAYTPGMGASLAMSGTAAVAEALVTHDGNFDLALEASSHSLRPFIEEVQTTALTMLGVFFVLKTEVAIRTRNIHASPV